MKELALMRHGKSAWDKPYQTDKERPLKSKGKKRTKKIARFLREKNFIPELIVSSDATRAIQTAKVIRKELGISADIKIEPLIYSGDEEDVLHIIYGLDNSVNRVLIIGHNPDFTELVNEFSDEPVFHLPTSGTLAVRFHTDKWENIPLAKKETLFFITPKML